MWLIQFHFWFSILCILCHAGIKIVFKMGLKRYKNNGRKPRITSYLLYFFPGINVLLLLALVYMANCDDNIAAWLSDEAQEDEE